MKVVRLMMIALSCLVILSACSNNEGNSPEATAAPTTQSTAAADKEDSKQDDKSNDPDTGVIEYDALKMLKESLAVNKQIENVSYTAHSTSSTLYYNPDNEDSKIEDFSYYQYDGTLQRDPAIAYIRSHRGSKTYEVFTDENYELIDGYNYFFDDYISKDLGWYYVNEDDGNWVHELVSDEFRTLEHIDEWIEFFISFPEQLTVTKLQMEEEFEGASDEIFYSIELNLTNDQFVSHIEQINGGFFNGTFDQSDYLDQTFYIISPELSSYRIALTVDEDYLIREITVDYESQLLDTTHDETLTYSNEIYFFNYNTNDPIVIPEDAIANAYDATEDY